MLIRVFFIFIMFINVSHIFAGNSFSKYMASQSLIWEELPYQWNEGAFIGNGIVGGVLYVDSVENCITLWLGRADVTDHRMLPGKKTSMGVRNASVMSDFCRLDIGKFKIFPDSRILSGSVKLNIYDGLIYCDLSTNSGNMKIIAYTPREFDTNIIEVEYSGDLECKYEPGKTYSPRFQVFPEQKKNYIDNPLPILVTKKDEGHCVYKLNAGGDYAVAWKSCKSNNKYVYVVSSANEVPSNNKSLNKAKEEIKKIYDRNLFNIRENMIAWWNKYWEKSIINIPDKQLENFYNIQMYKLAVNSTPNGPAIDNMGVLYKTTQWPGIWWNLNIQLTYMSTISTNRIEQGLNFITLMDEYFFSMVENNDISKIGDYTWALHTYYTMLRANNCDWKTLEMKVLPKLRFIIEKYKKNLIIKDGVYHLEQTESPEFEGFKKYNNSNYNLGLLTWSLRTAILISEKNNCEEDLSKWKEIENKLHPYVVDNNGFMIGDDTPVYKSHRHYSHLLSYYPLKLHDLNDEKEISLLRKSLNHWLTIDNGSTLAGYSYTGAASLYALLNDGNNAHSMLKRFLNSSIGISLLLPNTLYVETNGRNPVIETPLSAATAVAEMLLQTKNDVIHVFPAIPDNWSECSFKDLRTETGIVVSAEKKDNKLSWVSICSEKNDTCIISLKEWEKVYCLNKESIEIEKNENGQYILPLKANESLILSNIPKKNVGWKNPLPNKSSYYGIKKGKGLAEIMDWPN